MVSFETERVLHVHDGKVLGFDFGLPFAFLFLRRQNGVGVFPDLLRCLKQAVIGAVVVVFAVVGGISPTDLGTVFIVPTTVIRENVFAVSIDHQEPDILIDENGTVPVHDVPPHVIVVFPGGRRFDG